MLCREIDTKCSLKAKKTVAFCHLRLISSTCLSPCDVFMSRVLRIFFGTTRDITQFTVVDILCESVPTEIICVTETLNAVLCFVSKFCL